MPLTLHFDCALDPLVKQLTAQLAAREGDDPFANDVLLVPSMGAGRWLRRRITDHHGISGALEINLPGRFLWSLVAKLVPGVAPQSPFEPEVARWILLPLLERIAADPQLEPERLALLHARFSGRRPGPDELLPMAQAISSQFAQLLNHRRDWLDAWARGKTVADDRNAGGVQTPQLAARPEGQGPFARHENWMSWLWRELLERMPDVSQQHPFDRFAQWLQEAGHARASEQIAAIGLRRVLVFGMPQMSREQMSLLGQLATVADLTFLVPDPCREFWQDIVSPRKLAQIQQTRPDVAWLYEHEPAILGSWGRNHRDYLAQLRELEERLQPLTPVCVDDSFRERLLAPPGNRLQALTQAILTLSDAPWRELAQTNADRPDNHDDSLQLHAAPGVRRQVEVLRDRLLQSFAEMPDLTPDEVLVVAPDINLFVDAIDGVFGDSLIPYTIDGRRQVTDPVIKAMLQLMETASAPLSLDGVAVLLEEPAIALALGLDAGETALALRWLEQAGFREDTSAPAKHGWRVAMDRLWYGLAVAAERATVPYVMGQTMAVAGVSPSSLGLLSRLEHLADIVEQLRRHDAAQPDVLQWCELVAAGCGRWFGQAGTSRHTGQNGQAGQAGQSAQQQPLLDVLRSIAGEVHAARFRPLTPAADESSARLCRLSIVAFARLIETAATGSMGLQRVSSGVLFASLDVVRPYSARVTACLGFSDRDFPRQTAPLEFDLIQLRPRFGDPSPALADRGAFLDLICQTCDRLLFFYDGADLRSNERLNPSMLIAELLEYLQRQPGQGGWTATEHPLMRFLPAAFSRDRLPSFDAAAFRAALVLFERDRRSPRTALPAAARPAELARVPIAASELTQADWVNRLSRPARAYLAESLLIGLPRALTDTDRVEPLDVHDDLSDAFRSQAQMLLDVPPEQASDTTLAAIWPLQPHLPQGASGALAARALQDIRGKRLADTRVLAADTLLPLSAFVPRRLLWRGHWLTSARIQPESAADGSRLQFLWSAFPWNVRSLIDTWVCHQVARLLSPDGVVTTWWLGDDGARRFRTEPGSERPSAEQNLLAVVALAAEVASTPQPLFPRTWLTWVDKVPAEQRRPGQENGPAKRWPKAVTDAFEKELGDGDMLVLHGSAMPELEDVLQATQARYGWFLEDLERD